MAQRKEDEVSFKEHYEEKLDSIVKLEDERWIAHKEVHAMGQRAIDEAVKVLNTRLETMNEFRAQIANERGEFVKAQVYDSEHKALEAKMEAKMDAVDVRFGKIENYNSNQAGRTAAYVTVLGVLFAALEVLLHFWK